MKNVQRFTDRFEAGKVLAEELKDYANKPEVIILALPRGGVPVAYEVAKALAAELDVFIVRKLGVPWQEELAMGAIGMPGIVVFNDNIIDALNISQDEIDHAISVESQEMQRRDKEYRGNRPFPDLANKTVILVDDGIATGATIRAAIQALKRQNPTKIIVAVPVAAIDTCQEISKIVDKLICPLQPKEFYGVGAWYNDFSQTTDAEVHALLKNLGTTK